ncbi:hypothetical protein I79_004781 [Cricetulus griseus]|uniref:Uncharacterized protein n=1 Tax=Cricetulus griseus TaxID=10029 RepID=G3H3G5_CRIGR|nr:hypothetical protein I79_004781 [Cricetulus griseus]
MVLSRQGRKQVPQDHRETLVFQRTVNYAQLGSSRLHGTALLRVAALIVITCVLGI